MKTLTADPGQTVRLNKAGVVKLTMSSLTESELFDLLEGQRRVAVKVSKSETITGALVGGWAFADGVKLVVKPDKVSKASPSFDDALRQALGQPARPQPDLSGLTFDQALKVLLHG